MLPIIHHSMPRPKSSAKDSIKLSKRKHDASLDHAVDGKGNQVTISQLFTSKKGGVGEVKGGGSPSKKPKYNHLGSAPDLSLSPLRTVGLEEMYSFADKKAAGGICPARSGQLIYRLQIWIVVDEG